MRQKMSIFHANCHLHMQNGLWIRLAGPGSGAQPLVIWFVLHFRNIWQLSHAVELLFALPKASTWPPVVSFSGSSALPEGETAAATTTTTATATTTTFGLNFRQLPKWTNLISNKPQLHSLVTCLASVCFASHFFGQLSSCIQCWSLLSARAAKTINQLISIHFPPLRPHSPRVAPIGWNWEWIWKWIWSPALAGLGLSHSLSQLAREARYRSGGPLFGWTDRQSSGLFRATETTRAAPAVDVATS